jgi:hypothetical protein
MSGTPRRTDDSGGIDMAASAAAFDPAPAGGGSGVAADLAAAEEDALARVVHRVAEELRELAAGHETLPAESAAAILRCVADDLDLGVGIIAPGLSRD